jgi:hypothetical protein
MSNAEGLRQTYERLIAAVVANDPDALAGIISPDVVDHGAVPDQPPGIAGIVFWMRGMHASFSGLSGIVKVAGRVTWRGTAVGSFLGLRATGKPVTFSAMHFLRFERGLVAEWWGVPDLYGALTEIGAMFELPG